jgi:hypothetical protein
MTTPGSQEFDLVVLGGGPPGLAGAITGALLGHRVAPVKRRGVPRQLHVERFRGVGSFVDPHAVRASRTARPITTCTPRLPLVSTSVNNGQERKARYEPLLQPRELTCIAGADWRAPSTNTL